MQSASPKGDGGMIAVLGISIENMKKILEDNKNNFVAEIANDNSEGQIVISGKTKDLEKLSSYLKVSKIKNIKLPFHLRFQPIFFLSEKFYQSVYAMMLQLK